MSLKVNVKYLVPISFRNLLDWLDNVNCGIIYQNINTPELERGELKQLLATLSTRDINIGPGSFPSDRRDRFCRMLCFISHEIADDCSGAKCGKPFDHAFPEPSS